MKMDVRTQRSLVAMFVVALCAFVPNAMAFTAPAAGDFGYEFFDIAFNKILFGPIGWVGGGFLIALGLSVLKQSWIQCIVCILGAAGLIKLQSLMTTLGAVV